MSLSLDVGCAGEPRGDVNCDLAVYDVLGHRGLLEADRNLDVKKIPNFVICDAACLPFKSGVFKTVYCLQVIEHTVNPFAVLRELVRVSCYRVVVEVPNRFGEMLACSYSRKMKRWVHAHHKHRFSRGWFGVAANRLGCRVVKSYVVDFYSFPHLYFTVFRWSYHWGVVFEKL